MPPIVFQEDLGTGSKADAARGTVKAAVLKGDSKSHDLVIASCYDQKPYYMQSHSCSDITWDTITKRVYSMSEQQKIDFGFLRLNLSNEYNYEMNDNDIADQYRLHYRMMRFQRNYKWWWALWIWAVEVCIVNAYLMMKRYCELKGVKVPYDHHDFHEAIALAFLDRDNQFGNHWPRREAAGQKRKAPVTPVTPSSRPTKAPRVDIKSVNTTLLHRLDPTFGHFPSGEADYNRVCQLHRFAHRQTTSTPKNMEQKGKRRKIDAIPDGARKNVFTCTGCSVNLCISCWKIFHTEKDLSTKFDAILRE